MPFGNAHTPAVGRHGAHLHGAGGTARSLTLTAAQTAAAGAGLGTGSPPLLPGRRPYARARRTRRCVSYPYIQFATVAGQAVDHHRLPAPSRRRTTCTCRRADIPGHPWKDRHHADRRATSRAPSRPSPRWRSSMPAMWTNEDGGIGLQAALRRPGARPLPADPRHGLQPRRPGRHAHPRTTPPGSQMVSSCDPGQILVLRSGYPTRTHHVHAVCPLPRPRDRSASSGSSAAHLTPGNECPDGCAARPAGAGDRGRDGSHEHRGPARHCRWRPERRTDQRRPGRPPQRVPRRGVLRHVGGRRTGPPQLQHRSTHYKSPERPSAYGFGAMLRQRS